MLASLPPEEQPVAEQVLRGGIPAVRTALHLEREKAVAEGRPPPNTDQLIAMAEALLPRIKAAEWRDRADAAIKAADEISLRDLRSVVAGADVARDEESRALAATLREALEQRLSSLKTQWEEEVGRHLDERRLVRALRLAGRPPEPAARLDPELAQRLSAAASEAMSPETTSDRWLALIDAVASSPVRRTVQPVGLPPDPDPDLRRAAQQQSGRIPALAALLGIAIPPPPQPSTSRRPVRRAERPRPPRSGGPDAGGGGAGDALQAEPAGVAASARAAGEGNGAIVAEPAKTAVEPAGAERVAPVQPGAEATAAGGVAGAAPTPTHAPDDVDVDLEGTGTDAPTGEAPAATADAGTAPTGEAPAATADAGTAPTGEADAPTAEGPAATGDAGSGPTAESDASSTESAASTTEPTADAGPTPDAERGDPPDVSDPIPMVEPVDLAAASNHPDRSRAGSCRRSGAGP